MLDQKGNATTTTWQDNHSGRRRHKLMTKELGDTIPAIGANENVDDHDDVLAGRRVRPGSARPDVYGRRA